MIDLIIMVFATLGALFILIAAIGLVRMPDFYLRQSVTVKAATLGAGLIILAVALYFHQVSVFTKAVAVIFFLFVTAPVSGHMICRSAYISGNKMWMNSVLDELKGKYNQETDTLHGTVTTSLAGGDSALTEIPESSSGPSASTDNSSISSQPDTEVPDKAPGLSDINDMDSSNDPIIGLSDINNIDASDDEPGSAIDPPNNDPPESEGDNESPEDDRKLP